MPILQINQIFYEAADFVKDAASPMFKENLSALGLGDAVIEAPDNFIPPTAGGQVVVANSFQLASAAFADMDGNFTSDALGTNKQTIPFRNRYLSLKIMDLASILSGIDPAKEILARVSQMLAADVKKSYINLLKTLALMDYNGGANVGPHTHVIASNAVEGAADILTAKSKIGEYMDELTHIAIDTTFYAKLLAEKVITYTPVAAADGTFNTGVMPTLFGMRVIPVDFKNVANQPKVLAALFQYGELFYKFRKLPETNSSSNLISTDMYSLEVARNSFSPGGEDYFIIRTSYAAHANGASIKLSSINSTGHSINEQTINSINSWDRDEWLAFPFEEKRIAFIVKETAIN